LYGWVFEVRLSARRVRPWKPPSKATTAGRFVYERANLTEFSIASAPELKKAARVVPEMGTSSSRRSASAT
jgi:hypothetical protein